VSCRRESSGEAKHLDCSALGPDHPHEARAGGEIAPGLLGELSPRVVRRGDLHREIGGALEVLAPVAHGGPALLGDEGHVRPPDGVGPPFEDVAAFDQDPSEVMRLDEDLKMAAQRQRQQAVLEAGRRLSHHLAGHQLGVPVVRRFDQELLRGEQTRGRGWLHWFPPGMSCS
jgi:hypothetical protein